MFLEMHTGARVYSWVRDWSLITGRVGGYKTEGGGGHVKFYPYEKCGGGGGENKF